MPKKRNQRVFVLIRTLEECKKRLEAERDFEGADVLRTLENLFKGTELSDKEKEAVEGILKLI